MFEKVHHLTSARNWIKIQEEDVLKPLTKIEPGNLLENMTPGNYLVCVFPGDFRIWHEYGLLRKLESKIAWGGPSYHKADRSQFALLEIPVLKTEGAFVREHLYPTERYGDQFMPSAVFNVHDMHITCAMNEASKAEV